MPPAAWRAAQLLRAGGVIVGSAGNWNITASALQLLLMVVTGWLARRERHLIDLSHFLDQSLMENGGALQCSFEATAVNHQPNERARAPTKSAFFRLEARPWVCELRIFSIGRARA